MLLHWENKDQEKLRIYFSRSDPGKKSNQVTSFAGRMKIVIYMHALWKKKTILTKTLKNLS